MNAASGHNGGKGGALRLRWILYISLVVVVIADVFAPRHHPEYIWDRIPGWGAVYGFVSCVVLIKASKFIGHHWLMKREDYYDG
jgi:L-asparagine transporter-like permease